MSDAPADLDNDVYRVIYACVRDAHEGMPPTIPAKYLWNYLNHPAPAFELPGVKPLVDVVRAAIRFADGETAQLGPLCDGVDAIPAALRSYITGVDQ